MCVRETEKEIETHKQNELKLTNTRKKNSVTKKNEAQTQESEIDKAGVKNGNSICKKCIYVCWCSILFW